MNRSNRPEVEPAETVARWLQQAYLYDAQGRYANVVRACDEVLRLDPDHAVAHYLRGTALEALGDTAAAIEASYREALRECTSVLRWLPEHAEAREMRARLLERVGYTPDVT